MNSSDHAEVYLSEAARIAGELDRAKIEKLAEGIAAIRERGGRLFILGVGGSAGNASHAVNDFRKIADLECYTPTDNVSELTARINDEGWESAFGRWLKGSRLNRKDGVLVLSVGGGNVEKKVSMNIVAALKYAKEAGAGIFGIVGRDGGFTAQTADVCVMVPVVNPEHVTVHTEAFQSVILHLLVSHPLLQRNEMKWESVKKS